MTVPVPAPQAAALVRHDVVGAVSRITLDSPHNRNALSSGLIDALVAELAAAQADDRVRVIVLSHTGSAFCSGADLTETTAALASGAIPAARMGEALAAVWESTKPVVARIAGPARAGGLGLIAAADVAVSTREASFAFTEVRLGVIPAVISATVLPRLSARAAAELFLTAEAFDGERAEQIGLVNRAVAADELDATVDGYVASLMRGEPIALAAAKLLLRRGARPIRDELAELTELSVRFFTSAPAREGIAARMQKREPDWVRRAEL